MERLAVGTWLSYLDEEKRTNQPTETTRSLSDLRCRHRRALSDVFRLWSAQRGTLGAEILRHPSHRTWLWSGRVAPHVYPGKRSYLAGVLRCGQLINCKAIVGREHAAMGSSLSRMPVSFYK